MCNVQRLFISLLFLLLYVGLGEVKQKCLNPLSLVSGGLIISGLPQQDCQEEGDHRNRVACCRCNGCRGVLEAYVVQVHTQCVPTNSKITKSTQSTQSLKFYLPCNTGQVLHAHTLAMHRRTASGTTRMTWVVNSSCKSYSMGLISPITYVVRDK